jgi:methionyl-tRNA formyltransferase
VSTPAPARPERLVYLGTPAEAVPPLRALVAAGFDVALVVSRPDAKRGRGRAVTPSPVKQAALDLGLPVASTVDAATEVVADLGVVVAYGRIIGPAVLEALPMVNLHFSLLPRWRGAAPVERAILAGDERTGVCVMAVEEGLDTGGVYAREEMVIGPDETADELRARLVDVGTGLLVDTLTAGLGRPVPQTGEVTYAEKLQPDDRRLDWARPAVELHRVVRVGGATTTFRGRALKVWRARSSVSTSGPEGPPGTLAGTAVATVDGALELIEVQPEGRARMAAAAWVNGVRPTPNDRLGR